jgi:SagB-type dehydrogenase family enzyme
MKHLSAQTHSFCRLTIHFHVRIYQLNSLNLENCPAYSKILEQTPVFSPCSLKKKQNSLRKPIMRKNNTSIPLLIVVTTLAALISACSSQDSALNRVLPAEDAVNATQSTEHDRPSISLPEPDLIGTISLEQTLLNRRSVRQFQDVALTQAQIGQLLWAAQGITHPSGLRTAPSAGALYPLEVYAATQDGLFYYIPGDHSLQRVLDHDPRPDLHLAALGQDSVLEAPLVIVINGVFARTAQRYGEARTPQYVYLEAGHAVQNILLQAVALDLGAVPIGAFYEDQITQALSLPPEQTPLYLIPIGHTK